MQATRRNFLKGIMALTAVAVLPNSLKLITDLPTIWGDGIHDDAPGLNAMLAGNPFHVENDYLVADDGVIKGGTFSIKNTIYIPKDNFLITQSKFITMEDFQDDYIIHVKGNHGCITYCHFDGSNLSKNNKSALLLTT